MLTKEDKLQIIDMYNNNVARKIIAEHFSIHIGTVDKVLSTSNIKRDRCKKLTSNDVEVNNKGILLISETKEPVKCYKHKRDGYLRMTIDGKNQLVHRVIANKYIPNPRNLPLVNHINGVRDDNRVENLEWCNNKENVLHALRELDSAGKESKFTNKASPIRDTYTNICYASKKDFGRKSGNAVSYFWKQPKDRFIEITREEYENYDGKIIYNFPKSGVGVFMQPREKPIKDIETGIPYRSKVDYCKKNGVRLDQISNKKFQSITKEEYVEYFNKVNNVKYNS